MRRLLIFSALFFPAASLHATICYDSIRTVMTYETPMPSKGTGLLPFGFARVMDLTYQQIGSRNGQTWVMSTQTTSVSGKGWYSGLGWFCTNLYGIVNPVFINANRIDYTAEAWRCQMKVDQEIQGGTVALGFGCAGNEEDFQPSPPISFARTYTCQ